LLEALGKYQDAAELHLTEGRIFEAIRLFFKDGTNLPSILRGKECIIRGLWENLSFATKLSERLEEVNNLFKLASEMPEASTSVNPELEDEVGQPC